MATTVAAIQVDLRAQTSKLKGDLRKSRRAWQGHTKNVRREFSKLERAGRAASRALSVGFTAGAAGLVAATKASFDFADAIAKGARNAGVALENFHALRTTLELSGASAEQFVKASTTLSRVVVQAGEGLTTYERALERIGLSYGDLAGLSPEQQFARVIDALKGTEDSTVRIASALDLLGRGAKKFGTLFTPGAASFRGELDRLNSIIPQLDSRTTAFAERTNDNFKVLSETIKAGFAKGSLGSLEDVFGGIDQAHIDDLTRSIGGFFEGVGRAAGGAAKAWIGLQTLFLGTLEFLGRVGNAFVNDFLYPIRAVGNDLAKISLRVKAFFADTVEEGEALQVQYVQLQKELNALQEQTYRDRGVLENLGRTFGESFDSAFASVNNKLNIAVSEVDTEPLQMNLGEAVSVGVGEGIQEGLNARGVIEGFATRLNDAVTERIQQIEFETGGVRPADRDAAVGAALANTFNQGGDGGFDLSKGTGLVQTEVLPIAEEVVTNLESALGTAISTGNWDSLGDAFLSSVQAALVQSIVGQLGDALLGALGGGGGGGVGGFLSFFADSGGVVPGAKGSPQLGIAHGGEVILNAAQQNALLNRMNQSPVSIVQNITGNVDSATARALRRERELILDMVQGGLFERGVIRT